jgi:phospho-N-acetylmuramoyl-pentapeptide-transferase
MSRSISVVGAIEFPVSQTVFTLWIFLLLVGASNAVNLTDGLDGLAAGSSALVFGAFTLIAFWQFRNATEYPIGAAAALDVAVVTAAVTAAAAGFLWHNAPPARIFMGDTGSLALGGLMAAVAVATNTQLLLVVLGGLFVVETLSVVVQVAVFRTTGRRVFRMAPFHHHFELLGWQEATIIVRFWILAGIGVALGLGLFYAEYLTRVDLL